MIQKKDREIKYIFVGLTLFFLVFLAAPMVKVIIKSFVIDGTAALTIANYKEVLAGKGFMEALGNSFLVSSTSAAVTTVLAFVVAYSIHYTNIPEGFKNF